MNAGHLGSVLRHGSPQVGHVADGNNYYCPRASGSGPEWAETVALSGAGKAELVTQLKKSIMVTYLRMMGITPPSS